MGKPTQRTIRIQRNKGKLENLIDLIRLCNSRLGRIPWDHARRDLL
jgi:hypothetical protein